MASKLSHNLFRVHYPLLLYKQIYYYKSTVKLVEEAKLPLKTHSCLTLASVCAQVSMPYNQSKLSTASSMECQPPLHLCWIYTISK